MKYNGILSELTLNAGTNPKSDGSGCVNTL